jgi:copper homeostasis protein
VGKDKLQALVKLQQATIGPEILPGAGLAPDNINRIHETVQADQYHFGKALREEESFANGFNGAAFSKVKSVT